MYPNGTHKQGQKTSETKASFGSLQLCPASPCFLAGSTLRSWKQCFQAQHWDASGRFSAPSLCVSCRRLWLWLLPGNNPPLRTSKSVSLTKAVNFGVVAVFCNLTCSHLKPWNRFCQGASPGRTKSDTWSLGQRMGHKRWVPKNGRYLNHPQLAGFPYSKIDSRWLEWFFLSWIWGAPQSWETQGFSTPSTHHGFALQGGRTRPPQPRPMMPNLIHPWDMAKQPMNRRHAIRFVKDEKLNIDFARPGQYRTSKTLWIPTKFINRIIYCSWVAAKYSTLSWSKFASWEAGNPACSFRIGIQSRTCKETATDGLYGQGWWTNHPQHWLLQKERCENQSYCAHYIQ